jgi:hypothetical protein
MQKAIENITFQLDQRKVLQLQQFVLELAEQLPFQTPEHSWKDYLLKDITFRLVSLLSFDPDASGANLENWEEFIYETQKYFDESFPNDPFLEKLKADFEEQIKNSKLDSGKGDKRDKIRNFQHSFKANFCKHYLESLKQRSDHTPDVGLLLAFIDLFAEHLIPDLNQLPGKLTELYYDKLIDKKRLPPTADLAHVCFEPAKKALIPKGLPLYAGRDANNENIVFETLDDVQLSDARVIEVYTLFFAKPNLKDKEKYEDTTRGIYLYKCPFDGQGKSFETFGHNIRIYKKNESNDPRNAEFGFAISSKLLFLKEGKREITLEIVVEKIPDDAFNKFRNDVIKGDSNWKKLQEIFLNHISYYITTPNGWKLLGQPVINLNNKTFTLAFKLPERFKLIPIDAYYPFNYPTIKLKFQHPQEVEKNSKSLFEIELYNFFKKFTIKLTKIEVRVDGIKNLTCYNDLGVLNINQPFQPFTSTPDKNSTFIVGHAEAFQKPLSKVELELGWNLPSNFTEYFNGYGNNEIIDLNAYKINKKIKLFPDLNEKGIRPPITITELNEYQAPPEWQKELPDYTKDSQWGYFKLQLTAPDYPFGVGLYQKALNEIMQEVLELGEKAKIKLKDINPPLTPELTDIRLNYTASSDTDYQLFHIHPLGQEQVSTGITTTLVTQVYEHDEGSPNQGSLFIGIENLNSGLLSIYFELAGSSLIPSNSESKAETPAFFLVCNNKFEPLVKIADTTEGFEQSGIVQLNIPSQLIENNQTTILPDYLYWIVVTSKDNAESFGLTHSIHLHGARVGRTSGIPQFEQEQFAVAAGTIARTLNDAPAIKKVWQPYSSFAGRMLEDAPSFSRRVATEIRHRNRPTKIEDIEAIIYSAFPQVYFCRASMDNNALKILVVPLQGKDMPHHRPSFPITFLRKIKEFIEELVSPFLSIIVENPHYAIAQIHMYLEAKPGIVKFNPDQLSFNIKQDLVRRYLNPWHRECLDFGKSPDFIKLKKVIEKEYELTLKDFILYYYYIQGAMNTRYFGSYDKVSSANLLKKHMVFIPDPTIDEEGSGTISIKKEMEKMAGDFINDYIHHKIFIDSKEREIWIKEKKILMEAELIGESIIGFEKYRFTHLPVEGEKN